MLNCFLTTLNFDLSFCSTNTAANSLSLVVENCSSLLLVQIPSTREKNKQPTHPLKRLGVRKNLQNLCFTADSFILLSQVSHHQTMDAKKELTPTRTPYCSSRCDRCECRTRHVRGSIGLPFYGRDNYIPSGRERQQLAELFV